MGHRVLFVDVGNSTLGPMAEAFARHFGIDADSAGTMPAHEVSQGAVVALGERGVKMGVGRPKRIDFRHLADYERIIALGAGVAATSPDLHAHEEWDIDDPVNLDFAVYRKTCDQVEARVKDLAREIQEWSLAPGEEEAAAHATP